MDLNVHVIVLDWSKEKLINFMDLLGSSLKCINMHGKLYPGLDMLNESFAFPFENTV
jgi:hypothetical protein